jgi:hypothetical protein
LLRGNNIYELDDLGGPEDTQWYNFVALDVDFTEPKDAGDPEVWLNERRRA